MERPIVILDPGHGGEHAAFYDLDNGVRLDDTWEEVERLAAGEKVYLDLAAGQRWRRGGLGEEPRFYFERHGRRITYGDPGVTSIADAEINEKDVTLDVSRCVQWALSSDLVVKSTRDRDGYVSEESRRRTADRVRGRFRGPAVLVSLHADGGAGARPGIWVLHHPVDDSPLTRRLVGALLRGLAEADSLPGEPQAGESEDPLLVRAGVSGVAVQLGCLSHPEDAHRLSERHQREKLAAVLGRTLEDFCEALPTAPRVAANQRSRRLDRGLQLARASL